MDVRSRNILIVFVVGMIILSITIPSSINMHSKTGEPIIPDNPPPLQEFRQIDIYVAFKTKNELDYFCDSCWNGTYQVYTYYFSMWDKRVGWFENYNYIAWG
ncbi:MAG: hypothetical protein ACXAEX_08605 [Promethearchaeota archaeon]|jgi:hypothetical protein